MTSKKPKRTRLSLECSDATKRQIVLHGKELGQVSLIGTIRSAVARSRKQFSDEKKPHET